MLICPKFLALNSHRKFIWFLQVVEQLMRDEQDKPYLKITQRLRLDQAKLDDVSKRISSSTSHAIFLALASSSGQVPITDGAEVQSRPLRWKFQKM